MDKYKRIIPNGAIAIDGNIIVDIGKTEELQVKYAHAEHIIDASKKIVMPGLINVHNHMFQSLYRGLGDDLPLPIWLERIIWPLSRVLRRKAVYVGALLSALEMIKTGTTCVTDSMYIHIDKSNFDENAKGVEKSGIRAVLQYSFVNSSPVPEEFWVTPEAATRAAEEAVRKWHGKDNNRIMVALEPLNEVFASSEMIKVLKETSIKLGIRFHMHCAEILSRPELLRKKYGMGSVEYLHNLGVLDNNVLLAHCVWVTNKEIRILKETGTNVAHNPVSNQFLGDGVAPVPKFIKEGITVAIGTDGAMSNNNQDMFQAMKAAALLHKVHNLDPGIISHQEILSMATITGAKALGLENEIGSLEVGKKADIIIIRLDIPEMTPRIRLTSHLVYSVTGSAVDTSIINGKIVMENRKVTTMNEEEVIEMAQQTVEDLIKESGIKIQ